MAVTYAGIVPQCPVCHCALVIKENWRGLYWCCPNSLVCQVSHGAHPDGSPLGIPATRYVRRLRVELHALLQTQWDQSDKQQRKEMYIWLREHTESHHIARMDEDEILRTRATFVEWRNHALLSNIS